MAIISSRDYDYLAEAMNEANKSKVLMRHGCVAVVNGKIRGRGYNSVDRTQSKDNFIKNTCSCHAEIACLRNLYQTSLTTTFGKYSDNVQYVQG
jgi:tRNA(Arg) A34 adenosine deaminase TadA